MVPNKEPKVGDSFRLHNAEVTACVELLSPVCICTASLDKQIIMYDLNTKEKIRVLDGHRNGVKLLLSVPDFGGFLISCAFDVMPFVWQPGNIHGDCLLGKLKGHSSPVVSMISLPELPFIVTLDENIQLCFWDIRNLFCLQTLSAPKSGIVDAWSAGLIPISKSMFWLYRNSFESYDSQKIILNKE